MNAKQVKNEKAVEFVESENAEISEIEVLKIELEARIAKDFISFSAVAKLLNVRYQQVFQKHKQGKLDSVKINNAWYAKRESVDVWIARRESYFANAKK